jgi:hypothetical protein
MRAVFAFLIFVFISGLTACGEREQVVEPQSEKRYQGKLDGKPWDNAPEVAAMLGGTWKKGDRTSWEDSLRNRQLSQHEHKRIYQ